MAAALTDQRGPFADAPLQEKDSGPVSIHPEDASPLGFNRTTIPPWVITSPEFSIDPRRIELIGVREQNKRLFRQLDGLSSPVERAVVFNETMSVKFDLHQWQEHGKSGRRLKNNYLRFLRGWAVDSNSIEGAVLKGWVESRLGIAPTFHHELMHPPHARGGLGGESYMRYARERMRGHGMACAIDSQLDLLFEFCQYELERRGLRSFTLYRGTTSSSGQVLERRGARERLVRLNSLCSFTLTEDRAWEFGDTVWRAEVPAERVFHFASLLPNSILKCEDEVMVIGGAHWVTEIR